MEVQAALNIIKEVCAKFVGNLVDHQNIQIAVQTLENAVMPKVPEAKPEKPAKKQK